MPTMPSPFDHDPGHALLDAAAQAFAAHGYEGTQVRDVAAAASIDAAALAQSFDSKLALYAELARVIRDETLARGGRAMAAAGSLEARFAAACAAFFGHADEHPERAAVLVAAPLFLRETLDVMHELQDDASRRLAGMLAIEPTLLPDDPERALRLQLCAEFIRCGLHGLVRWQQRHAGIDGEQLAAAAIDVAWHGLDGLRRNG